MINLHYRNTFFAGTVICLLIITISPLFAGKNNKVLPAGITPYGLKVPLIQRKIKRKKFTLTIIYSDKLSDNIMSKYMKLFFEELCERTRNVVYARNLRLGSMKIVISNCRFCSIGYCRKINKKRVKLTGYKNSKEIGSFSFSHKDLINQKKYAQLIKNAIAAFFR